MNVDKSKSKILIFLMFLMACYFIGINFLDDIDDKNENNVYVSLNLIVSTKEDYIGEYISYIQNEKYNMAYSMLSDTSKEKFDSSIDSYKKYALNEYKEISKESWKFKFKLLNSKKLKKMNIYEYSVLDEENEDEAVIEKITVNEYASNVYKIDLN